MNTLAPRQTLDRQLKKLNENILMLSSMVEEATLKSVTAFQNRDVTLAKLIYAGDERINEIRFSLENETLTIIATQQPMARDLRILASTLEVITELERMGDYAKGIAKITLLLSNQPPLPYPSQVSKMAELAVDMLHQAIGAFAEQDAATAEQIPLRDDEVDALYNEVNRWLIKLVSSEPASIDRANYLMWAAHNLERMADRVTNICERTLFIVTGKLQELGVSDDEFGAS